MAAGDSRTRFSRSRSRTAQQRLARHRSGRRRRSHATRRGPTNSSLRKIHAIDSGAGDATTAGWCCTPRIGLPADHESPVRQSAAGTPRREQTVERRPGLRVRDANDVRTGRRPGHPGGTSSAQDTPTFGDSESPPSLRRRRGPVQTPRRVYRWTDGVPAKGVSDSTGRGDERPPQNSASTTRAAPVRDDPSGRGTGSAAGGRSGLLTGRPALDHRRRLGIRPQSVAVAFRGRGRPRGDSSCLNRRRRCQPHHATWSRPRGCRCPRLRSPATWSSPDEHSRRRRHADAWNELGGLDPLVDNVAFQQPVSSPDELSDEQWVRTFDVNIDSSFRVTKAALPHLS